MPTTQPDVSQMPQLNKDLFDHLLDSYAGPLNRDRSTFWPDEAIRVDDESSGDVADLFCRITVQVSTTQPGALRLKLSNTPMPVPIANLIREQEGTVEEDQNRLRAEAEVWVSLRQVTFLRRLAKAYGRVVKGRGRNYPDPNWRWVCDRTQQSLDRLADNIWQFRKNRRHGISHP